MLAQMPQIYAIDPASIYQQQSLLEQQQQQLMVSVAPLFVTLIS